MADNEEDYDEAPSFIDMSTAVEVNLPDDGEPMDDDDDVREPRHSSMQQQQQQHEEMQEGENVAVVDLSKVTIASHNDAVYAISAHYHSDSKILSIVSGAGDDRAYLHFVSPGTPGPAVVRTIPLSHSHTDSISTVSFNTDYIGNDVSGKPQRNLIAVGSYDGAIVLYDAADGGLVKVLEGPSDVEWCCFHPKGGTVLLAGSIADGTIWMYHTPSSQCLQVFVGHENGVTAGAFTPDGKWVVSAGQDGTVRVWAPKTGLSKHVFRLMEVGMGGVDGHPGAGLTCLAVGGGSDGQLVIAGGEDGNAYVVHVAGKKLVATLTHFDNNAAGTVTKDRENDGMEDDEEGETRSVEAVGFCPANIPGTAHWCATGGVDGVLKIWNLNVGGGAAQLRQKCVREDVKAGITRLKWHNSSPLVIATYTDGCICVWDARVGKIVECLTGHDDMINDMDVCFVDDGAVSVIVTGSDDKEVKVFEFSQRS